MATKQEIENILKSRNLSDFVGTKENIIFEAKRKNPYDFDSPEGRYEFAKDVSAMLNASGGYIIIGLAEDTSLVQRTNEVKSLDLFSKREINISKYEGILAQYIEPKLRDKDVEFQWVEDNKNTGKGVLSIKIQKQSESKKYFLMKKVLEDNKKLKEIVFGVAIRKDPADTDCLTVDRLWNLLQRGKGEHAQRLSNLERMLEELLSIVKKDKSSRINIIKQRINNILN